eukprot:CAMPEP_0170182880 /NCGR_PEP_ID=MMETSP0040_2-20121228/29046_1 /TAXON_ID=641309 /ORGANISM="Lotharella oceanica, Strain CCMP622" /LENGTH=102 /DNA_ID=CAMNT_0010428445 /DNA_START=91 /DNA_END=395 /DNA_ORIENTATION=-
MAWGMFRMPRFDAMDLCLSSKGVIGFNLSFFADERGIIESYLNQVTKWIDEGKLKAPKTSVFKMDKIGDAHALIQSGRSIGKIVVQTPCGVDDGRKKKTTGG